MRNETWFKKKSRLDKEKTAILSRSLAEIGN